MQYILSLPHLKVGSVRWAFLLLRYRCIYCIWFFIYGTNLRTTYSNSKLRYYVYFVAELKFRCLLYWIEQLCIYFGFQVFGEDGSSGSLLSPTSCNFLPALFSQSSNIIASDGISSTLQAIASSSRQPSGTTASSSSSSAAGAKIAQCTLCPYKASSYSHLKRHLRTHSGERPYACTFCSYRATQHENLKIHLRIHTGEKPFPCPHCTYRATVKHNLVRHITLTHSNVNNTNSRTSQD